MIESENPDVYAFGALDLSGGASVDDSNSTVLHLAIVETVGTPIVLSVTFKTRRARLARLTAYLDDTFVLEVVKTLFQIIYSLFSISQS